MERRRQMGDIGIVAQRYELVLFGNHERLELQPWQPETSRTVKVDYKFESDTWYTMKLEVQTLGAGKVRARGKVWPKGQPEPAGVDDRAHRSDRQHQGRARTLRRCAFARRRRFGDLLRQHQGLQEQVAVRGSREFADSLRELEARAARPEPDKSNTMSKISTSAAGAIGLVFVSSLALIARSDPGKGDWPMWGGTPDRNMVSA